MDPEAYRLLLRAKLARVILTTGREGPGHATTVFSGEAVEELLNVIALVSHNSAEVSSPTKTRAFCSEIARKLQRRISEVQRIAGQGGLGFVVEVPEGPKH